MQNIVQASYSVDMSDTLRLPQISDFNKKVVKDIWDDGDMGLA